MREENLESYLGRKGDLLAIVASALEEMVMDTWGMLLKARFPRETLLVASLQLLIHPNQPASIVKFYLKYTIRSKIEAGKITGRLEQANQITNDR